jgi:hypothetical protein
MLIGLRLIRVYADGNFLGSKGVDAWIFRHPLKLTANLCLSQGPKMIGEVQDHVPSNMHNKKVKTYISSLQAGFSRRSSLLSCLITLIG